MIGIGRLTLMAYLNSISRNRPHNERWRQYARLFCFGLALALIGVRGVQAHAADMYFHTHILVLSGDGAHITWEITPGPLLAHIIWHHADQDQDEAVSDAEAWDWARGVASDFYATLDGSPVALDLEAVEWPADIPQLFSGEQPICLHLHVPWRAAPELAHEVIFENRYDPQNSMVWFEVQGDGIALLETPEQQEGLLRVHFESDPVAETPEQSITWESGRPTFPWLVESLGLGEDAEATGANGQGAARSPMDTRSILQELVKKESISPAFVVVALAVAGLLGALHALSPGHGKTIVAAYLVGSQGKFYHALALGALVTLTHTGSVFALGLLTLTASRYLVSGDIFPVLEFSSGVLISTLGVGLLYPRLRRWGAYRHEQRQRRNRPLVAERDPVSGRTRLLLNQPIGENEPPHSHDLAALGYVPRGPASGAPLANIRWRSLVTLGIGGGLVPCPDAIAILLIAATLNRIVFGLSLIVAFSAGLALVLMAIGVLIVQGRRLFARLQWFTRMAYVMPVLSALVVLGMGLVLAAGALGNLSAIRTALQTLPLFSPAFKVQEASILYTALDENNAYQLFTLPVATESSQQITRATGGVWHYAVSPDCTRVIYVTATGGNRSQLWQWTPATGDHALLLDCSDAFCSDVVWFPDGLRILYSRLEFTEQANTAGFPSLWWLDPATQETAPLFQEAQVPGFSSSWSPDGRKLSYIAINPQEIKIYDVETGARQSLPTKTGYPVVWSPDGAAVAFIDLVSLDGVNFHRLFRYDLREQTATLLTTGQPFDEDYPAWAPNGEWLAVVRIVATGDSLAHGSQIWLVRPDGSAAHPLMQNYVAFHGQPVWSPDSRYLLYNASPDSSGASTIHIFDTRSGDDHAIPVSGNRLAWLLPTSQAQ